MEQSLEEISKKKDEFQVRANDLKRKRDKLHTKAKQLADERDVINQKIRELRNAIGQHKKARDEFNERVKHSKEERNKFIKMHADVKNDLRAIQKDSTSKSGVNINQLKLTLRKLETDQMTQAMSSRKEKKLIETIREIHQKIKDQEQILQADPKLKEAIEEEKTLKIKIEKQHENVEKLAKRAQEEHESMIELVKSLENLSKKGNELQETIVLGKIEADKIHKDFIEHVNTIHEMERQIATMEKKKHKEKKQEESSMAQQEATDVYDRFKRGEKLSTEDLMILQKAGLI